MTSCHMLYTEYTAYLKDCAMVDICTGHLVWSFMVDLYEARVLGCFGVICRVLTVVYAVVTWVLGLCVVVDKSIRRNRRLGVLLFTI